MLTLVANVYQSSGVSRKTGQPFTMYSATVLLPYDNIDSPNYKTQGKGVRAVELQVRADQYEKVSKLFGEKFTSTPLLFNVEMTMERGGVAVITSMADPRDGSTK